MEFEENEKTWSRKQIKLLVVERLSLENVYQSGRKSKKTIWGDILREIKKKDDTFPFTVEEIVKKYTNLFTTYKRIKKRHSSSGSNRNTWEYFEDFDQVFGSKHFVEAPSEIIYDSMNDYEEQSIDELDSLPPKKKKKQDEILAFLKEQEKEDKKRHNEFMDLEKEKFEFEKQKLEVIKEYITIVRELRYLES